MIWEAVFLCGVLLFSVTVPLTGWIAFYLVRERQRDLERRQAILVQEIITEIEGDVKTNAQDVANIERLIGVRIKRARLPN